MDFIILVYPLLNEIDLGLDPCLIPFAFPDLEFNPNTSSYQPEDSHL